MTDPRQDRQHNAAWQAAQQWRERAQRHRHQGSMSGFRLIFTWLLFGALMIIGTLLGLFFLLIGWAMLPFLRYRMKKRMERMRAERAQDIGGGFAEDYRRPGQHQDVLEGQYEVKNGDRQGR